jgi:hypothetical protein
MAVGGFQYNFGRVFAIKGDFQGYGSTTVTFTNTGRWRRLTGRPFDVPFKWQHVHLLVRPAADFMRENLRVWEYLLGGSAKLIRKSGEID